MHEEHESYNGIDGSTGLYLPIPGRREVFGNARTLDPRSLRAYRWWVERYGINDPNRGAIRTVDPNNLAEAGWGVIWAPDIGPGIRKALHTLLKLREEQAGKLFWQFDFKHGDTKQSFLLRYGAGGGPADPRKVPYYLLIVGSPDQIPFRFQYELDVQYAVGRVYFNEEECYKSYAESVAAVENREGRPRPKRLTLFGTRNPGDRATRRTANELVQPLARMLRDGFEGRIKGLEGLKDWKLDVILAEQATKEALRRNLGGEDTPGLLFTACHGMLFSKEHDLQLRHQGALLCQDWPGPEEWPENVPIPTHHYFSADDVPEGADLQGLIVFHFACFSAGTPALSDFDFPIISPALQSLATKNFLAPLAQRLLGHPCGGALAVLGHVDRAWTISFSPAEEPSRSEEPQKDEMKERDLGVYESLFHALLEGDPIGSATEYLNQRHAELSVELNSLWAAREFEQAVPRNDFFRTWKANNDAKNFVVLGDPSVRLTGSGSNPGQKVDGGTAAA